MIDGASNSTRTIALATSGSVAINPITDKIYILGNSGVVVMDGVTNATATVAAGSGPSSVAVNVITNQVYVSNYSSGNVTVIDGSTDATTTVAAGTDPESVAVNPVTNKVYVTNPGSNNVTVIDGATYNITGTVQVGTTPDFVAVNPVTNKIYVANHDSNNVTLQQLRPQQFLRRDRGPSFARTSGRTLVTTAQMPGLPSFGSPAMDALALSAFPVTDS